MQFKKNYVNAALKTFKKSKNVLFTEINNKKKDSNKIAAMSFSNNRLTIRNPKNTTAVDDGSSSNKAPKAAAAA